MQLIPVLVGSLSLALAPVVSAQIVFGPAQSTPLAGTDIPRFATGDLDGDGFDDLVVGNPGAPGLRLGDGAGHFGPEIPIDTDAAGGTVAVADMNGDEVLDLVVGSSQTSRLSVALGDDAGGFLPSLDSTLGGGTIVNRLVLDVRDGDGDGDIDVLAVTPAPDPGASNGDARLFRNFGDGQLGLVGVFPGGQFQPKIVSGLLGDLNADGLPDVVLLTNQGSPNYWTRAWLCQPDAGFVMSWSAQGTLPHHLADLDGDGDLDLLAGVAGGLGPQTLLNAGDGTFTDGPELALESEFGYAIDEPADFDGDGILDLPLTGEYPAELWVAHGTGDGGFEDICARVSLGPGNGSPVLSIAGTSVLGDLDGDGRPDVVTGVENTFPSILAAALDRSYATGGPLLDLGHQLVGAQWPILIASGSFQGGQPFAFDLSGAPPSGTAYLILGFTQLLAPFKGGVMVPLPTLILGPWPVSSGGELALAGTWPSVPSGLELALQFWLPDPVGAAGFAASSGVLVTMP
jgi:hypothetical protein